MTAPVPDPLGRPATLARVQRVVEAVAPSDEARAAVMALAARTPEAREWTRFLASALLLLGAVLVLSGVISFFAFNWAALGRLAKLGLVSFAIAANALAALRPGKLSERVALLLASGQTGALLAVHGQAYQTGADPWSLFATWAVLILPWTLVAMFTPLWLLWLAIVDLAYGLYVAQVIASPMWAVSLLLGLLAVHVLALMAWELQAQRARPWLPETWAPRLVMAATMLPLLVPSVVRVMYPQGAESIGAVALASLTFLVIVSAVFYSAVRRDTFMLTLAAASVMAIVTTAVARLLMDTLDLGILGLMIITVFIVLEVTLAVSWLRRQSRGEAA